MITVWKEKTEMYCRGLYVVGYELYVEYYAWELDPMNDTSRKHIVPAHMYPGHKAEFMIRAYRTYCDEKCVYTSEEPIAVMDGLDRDTANAVWMNLKFSNAPALWIKMAFEANNPEAVMFKKEGA